MRRRGWSCSIGIVALVLVGCASHDVRVTQSDQIPPRAPRGTPTTEPGTTEPGTTDPGTTVPGAELPDVAPVEWAPCADAAAPWECGSIEVPLDYGDAGGRQISIALNRLPATGTSAERIGALVLNPGGPGGSGKAIALGEADSFPDEIRTSFDVVGFDPRGVGDSTAVECPPGFDVYNEFDLEPCIELSADLLPYLGTPNVARDLELIRIALGDAQLTYVGYSYGTALGAVYANMFPDSVRALVLDGAIDPDAGLANERAGAGYDFYAQQDFDGTLDVFHVLCDLAADCAAGPDSESLLDDVYDEIRDLPVAYFGDGERLRRADVDDVVYGSMYGVWTWPMLAFAIRDAVDGDASTLAALSSYLLYGYPADMESEPNFDIANIAIRCADFSNRGTDSYECEQFPRSAEAFPIITAAATATPVLVIGTAGDPATPGRYADQLADALGNAVDVTWLGAGHTAYLTSSCVTDLATAYLVDLIVPDDGTECEFVAGATTQRERADTVFAPLDRDTAVDAITPLLVREGIVGALASCVAAGIVDHGDERLVVHEILGVESPGLVALRDSLVPRCGGD